MGGINSSVLMYFNCFLKPCFKKVKTENEAGVSIPTRFVLIKSGVL